MKHSSVEEAAVSHMQVVLHTQLQEVAPHIHQSVVAPHTHQWVVLLHIHHSEVVPRIHQSGVVLHNHLHQVDHNHQQEVDHKAEHHILQEEVGHHMDHQSQVVDLLEKKVISSWSSFCFTMEGWGATEADKGKLTAVANLES